ncbi:MULTISPECIES: hypothetical protein [Agrobacterium]|uniref:hypothetical protein n=1 Tax=Agrobacterium tumefaciens TaxID=358 RepID=UPI00157395F1|nr:hypothetical protein [Agrobacterium tumefaciens]NSZ06312.1 hypothetical protein [Agrobacterium tumefaciens]
MPIDNARWAEIKGKSIFPEARSVASFKYRTQIIGLDEIDKAEFERFDDVSAFGSKRSVVSTIYHELTHWSDLLGTIWGRRYLRTVHSALGIITNLRISGMEKQFWKMVALHDADRRLMLPGYYRVQEGHGDLGSPKNCRVDFSGGIEFDANGIPNPERPILFVRFYGSGTFFIRQPLVVGALLETTAMWSELKSGIEVAATLESGAATVENIFIDNELRGLLEDPTLTIYTAPARMVSHFADISEYRAVYELAASLAYVCLNLRERDYSRLRVPALMNVWGKRNDASRKNMDPAYAFAAICVHGGRKAAGQAVEDWLDLGLARAGLPQAAAIRQAAVDAMRGEAHLPPSPWALQGKYLREAGIIVADARSRSSDPALTMSLAVAENLPLPPLVDSNLEVGRLPYSSFEYDEWDPNEMFDVEYELIDAVGNMLSACR